MHLAPLRSLVRAAIGGGALCAALLPIGAQRAPSTLILNVSVVDGTGAAPRRAAVRIANGHILAVGALTPARGEHVVDGGGFTLAPGFIDTHSHHGEGLDSLRTADAVVSQGVTTIVVGQDGGSHLPLRAWFAHRDSVPAAVNVASYSGHGSLRERVMGKDFKRYANDLEVAQMRVLLREELAAGALGLSSGLEYDPGIYATTSELVTLARTASAVGGRYISHVRSEDRGFWQAIDEIITIGREAHIPVQLSHAKLAMRSLWGHADSLIGVLDRARVAGVNITADIYPYTFWQSTLTVVFPERDFTNRASAEFALREVASAEGMLIGRFAPDPGYVGKTVAEIATLRGTDPATTLMDLIALTKNGELEESVIATSMNEADVSALLAWPWANVCSDGELRGRHPRGWGSFPRVLGHFVREGHVTSLAEMIRKMTSLAAANVGIAGRGTIAPGMAADLVLFDPAMIADRATPSAPRTPSVGVARVWVNGAEVYRDGAVTGATPGQVLRRAPAPRARR